MRRARTLVPAALVTLAVVLAGCSDDDGGDAGGDGDDRVAAIAALVESGDYEGDGEELYGRSCASCHGGDGQGGIGPQLAGVVEGKYTPEEHIGIVLSGRGTMPAFGASLDDDVIAAIVDYERTGLGEG